MGWGPFGLIPDKWNHHLHTVKSSCTCSLNFHGNITDYPSPILRAMILRINVWVGQAREVDLDLDVCMTSWTVGHGSGRLTGAARCDWNHE